MAQAEDSIGTPGKPDKTGDDVDRLWRNAIHEAGHVWVRYSFGLSFEYAAIVPGGARPASSVRAGRSRGRVEIDRRAAC